jgi:hypothetical protein
MNMTNHGDPRVPRFIPNEQPTRAQPVVLAPRPPRRAPRRQSHWLRWTLLAVVAFAVGVAAVAAWKGGLTASALTGKAKPLTCHQQYAKWKTGPAKAEGLKLAADEKTVQNAGDDIVTIGTGLKAAGTDAGQMEAYPMPTCADPAGYYRQMLTDIKASGDNAGSTSGLAGLLAAEVPLKKVPALETKLTAELARTTR